MMKPSLFELLPLAWRTLVAGNSALSLALAEIDEQLGEIASNPRRDLLFNAFMIDPDDIKVVIVGQDPYPQSDHAHGLAFSVPKGISSLPPTLSNIFKEYESDLGFPRPDSGDLTPWRDQGVFLLNSILSCAPGETLSHKNLGWQNFTRLILEEVVTPKTVAILWGEKARSVASIFSEDLIITSAHPSPLSSYRGFFGSRPFSRANELLKNVGQKPIDWRLQSG